MAGTRANILQACLFFFCIESKIRKIDRRTRNIFIRRKRIEEKNGRLIELSKNASLDKSKSKYNINNILRYFCTLIYISKYKYID